MKAGKVWGTTELIEANGALEFHRIEMKKNGVWSKHLHKYKWNGFFVESGKMRVKVWQKDYDLIDETIIGPGQYTKVKPGLYHLFECLEDGVAYELYWAEFAHNDIVRETTGFMGNQLTDYNGNQFEITVPTLYEEDFTPGGSTFKDSSTSPYSFTVWAE